MNITDPIRARAREHPDSIAAVRHRGTTVTYAAFERSINAMAKRLRAMGLGPGDIAIVATRVPQRDLVLRLALARLGAASATLALPVARAKVCFVGRGEDASGHPHSVQTDRGWFDDIAPDGEAIASHQDGTAVVSLFTSTSPAGRSRLVAVTHDMIAARIEVANHAVPMPDPVRQLCVPRTLCAHGFLTLMRVLWAGGTNVMAPNRVEDVVTTVRDNDVNRMVLLPRSVPPILAALPRDARPLPSLMQIELSGGALPVALELTARARLCESIHSVYRTTEGGFVAAAPVGTLKRADGEVGVMARGVEVVAIDANGAELPAGTEGLLRLRGAGFVGSYLDDPEATASAFRDGGFVPGDVGSVAADGKVRLAERETDMINAGGSRVHPRAIEEALKSIAWIGDAAAFELVDEHGIAQVAAAIVPTNKGEPRDIASLRERWDAMAPAVLMFVDAIPRNRTGGVMREALLAMVEAGRGTSVKL